MSSPAPWPVCLALLALGCARPEGPENLLLFVLDTTRADHLGCYGNAAAETPRLDRLAAEGARFDEALAQSSLTPVSAASVLTGRYPTRHGIRSLFGAGRQALAGEVPTLAEVLGGLGLATAAFVSAGPMGSRYGLDRGFAEYHDQMRARARVNRSLGLGNPNQRRADETTQLALDWLEQHAAAPFALLVHYFDAHDATLVPPREFLLDRIPLDLPAELDQLGNLAGANGAPDVSPDPVQRRALYRAEIAYMDREVGRILDSLERHGRLDSTLVVVIGDHGEGLGQHDFWTHGLLYREQLRVPLLMRGPGIESGRVVSDRVRLVDILPTVIDLFGAGGGSGELDGTSLEPLLAGGVDDTPREVYSEVHHSPGDFLGRDARMYALVDGALKYVHRPETGAHELYDVALDPNETSNLYRPDHPRVRALRKRMRKLGAFEEYSVAPDEMEPEQVEALKELGYLGGD